MIAALLYLFPIWWSILYGISLRVIDYCMRDSGKSLYVVAGLAVISNVWAAGFFLAFVVAAVRWHSGKQLLKLFGMPLFWISFTLFDITQGALMEAFARSAGKPHP